MRSVHSLSVCVVFARGVFQSLVEKHFPAPDRQKLFSLLGIDLPSKKPAEANNNAQDQKGTKRKGLRLGLPPVTCTWLLESSKVNYSGGFRIMFCGCMIKDAVHKVICTGGQIGRLIFILFFSLLSAFELVQ